MKNSKWTYIWVLVLLFSCANRERSKNSESMTDNEVSSIPEIRVPIEEAYVIVIRQKLEEQLELYKLRQNHPEFGNLTDKLSPFKNKISQNTQLQEIRIIHQKTTINGKVLEVLAQLKDSTEIRFDTLKATIVTKEVNVAGEVLQTTDISFQ